MRGLEIPAAVVDALGTGRPAVVVTINGHSWRTRVAILRGRHLIGLSHANRKAAGANIGDVVDVVVRIDVEPRVLHEPADLAAALDADPRLRAVFDSLSASRRRQHVLSVERAARPETRSRRIAAVLTSLDGTD